MPVRTITLLFLFLLVITGGAEAQKKQSLKEVYDFVPGEKVIFADDFSKDTIGKFPSGWKKYADPNSSNSVYACTVEKDNDGNYMDILNEAEPILVLKKNILGDSFTVEYDFLPGDIQSSADVQLMSAAVPTFSTGCYINGNGELNIWSPYWKGRKNKMNYPGTFALNTWHHFAVAYKKKIVKFYIDHYWMFTMDSCDLSRNNLYLDPKGPLKIRYVRIATGDPSKPFDQLLAEKKFVTHAINFDVNKSTIKPASMAFIAQLAQFLKANPSVKLEIVGYTDCDGDSEWNLQLSFERAYEVRKQLIAMGINGNRLTTKGLGASKPIQPNTTEEGKANNRRVEFIRK